MSGLPLPDGVSHVVTFAEYARVGGELERTRAQLAACAAGPWRTDVENAPRDGGYILGVFIDNHPLSKSGQSIIPAEWSEEEESWDTMEGYFGDCELLAFAIPNPPQVAAEEKKL